MTQFIGKTLLVTLLSTFIGAASATPTLLSDAQMDQVSAGVQYSFVEGAGTAANGFVLA